jgi:uncharacterized protein (UPF0332 family)
MSFNWSEYLHLADALSLQKETESCLRSAISRAYYAAFCEARNYARNEGLKLSESALDHDAVTNYYEASPVGFRKKIGADLRRLRVFRNRADYDDAMVRVDAFCDASLKQAHEVLNYLKKI